MTDTERLAAEYALGLLEGEGLMRARGLIASDPDFASQVIRWETRLGPLLDEVLPALPREDLWKRIEAELALESVPAVHETSNVAAFERRLTRWKWATGISSAAAAIALAFVAFPATRPPATQPAIAEAPLVSSIPIGEGGLRLEVTYLAAQQELLVSATGLSADGVHDHELWVVASAGDVRSLGLVTPGEVRKASLDEALAAQLQAGAQLVLTREPIGGAVPGTPAGPVVASGEFTAI
ncbi:anti-sigma factor [Altererythrobacter sp.]|nr:anti-sigma factor [Altererythrobacter sp.]